jgi:hypothetical protein
MKPAVYLETTIISYLVARPSRDVVTAGMQAETHAWWNNRREHFRLLISEPVVMEIGSGDTDVARRRLEVIADIPTVPATDDIRELARTIIARARLPRKAAIDAAHIAFAAAGGASYLLTWICRHIANAALRPRIESACRERGVEPPIICTPPELM